MATVSDSAADAKLISAVTRGAFIVLEGLDRSGKSTQVALLEKRLLAEGKKVKMMRFPGRFSAFLIVSHREPAGSWTGHVVMGRRADEDENAA